MENKLPDVTTAISSTRIDIVDAAAHDIKTIIIEIEQRLQLVVERLAGGKPIEAPTATDQPDPPGSFGSIDSKQNEARIYLDRVVAWMNELEQLV